MLILLPPSEGKTAPARGPRLDARERSFPGLEPPRAAVLDALIRTCSADPRAAARVLGLGPTQGAEVGANARLRQAPCGPTIEVYTGVLYEALSAATLPAPARRRLQGSVAIASALFGLVRPLDPIPAYRLNADVELPGIGPLAPIWRGPVGAALETATGPVLDLRSGAYARLAPVPASLAPRALTGRVLLERDGRRGVVSHHNKATKGRLVRALMTGGPLPRSIDGLMAALARLGFGVELHESAQADRPGRLDIVVQEV